MSERGEVITFYSYKGGVGRTMALANVACQIAALNRHLPILIIDFDLEAPGLHRFFKKASAAPKYGVIELFEYLAQEIETSNPKRGVADPDIIRARLEHLPWKDYIGPSGEDGIDIMRAGAFDDRYATRVNGFDWNDLYTRAPELFSLLAEYLAEHYSYVLIDSRTGVTDTSGICTALMPEKLVVVFTPNEQSLGGAVQMVEEAARHRKSSGDLRPLMVFPLPTRIDNAELMLKTLWWKGDGQNGNVLGYQPTFEALLREIYDLPACDLNQYFERVQIPYIPRFAYGETIASHVEAGGRLSMTASYSRFVEYVLRGRGPWDQPVRSAGWLDGKVQFARGVAARMGFAHVAEVRLYSDPPLKIRAGWQDRLDTRPAAQASKTQAFGSGLRIVNRDRRAHLYEYIRFGGTGECYALKGFQKTDPTGLTEHLAQFLLLAGSLLDRVGALPDSAATVVLSISEGTGVVSGVSVEARFKLSEISSEFKTVLEAIMEPVLSSLGLPLPVFGAIAERTLRNPRPLYLTAPPSSRHGSSSGGAAAMPFKSAPKTAVTPSDRKASVKKTAAKRPVKK